MHHPESSGDSASTRKMAHPAIFPRRGSISALTTATSTSVSNNVISAEDYQPPLLIQPPPPAGSSSSGPQHPPQSLNLLSQSQPLPSVGAQMKKKSGFQITSVTPAQVSVSTNNSIAEDTESYDDLDESHTEDLSSSEILDVSLSRATDMGGPLRSSSEETLNNFHEAETPGAVSPNQPHLSSKPSHHLPQTHQQGTIVNGTVHHQHHHHHGQHHQVHVAQPAAAPPSAAASSGPSWTPEGGGISASATSTTGILSSISQVIPATAGAGSVTAPPLANVIPGMLPAAAGAPISGVNTLASNISRLSSANTPVLGMANTKSSSTGVAPGPASGGTGIIGSGSKNIHLVQKQPVTAAGSVAMTTATLTGGSSTAGTGTPGTGQPTQSAPHSQAQQPAQVPAGSRFRVVKLDSSSESFRKGRWTCTDYYDKEAPPANVITASTTDTMPSHRPVESSAAVEREAVVSEEASGSAAMQAFQPAQHQPSAPQLQDYGTHPGLQPSHPSLAQSVPQPLGHPQDMVHPLLKTSAPPPVPTSMGSIRPPAMVTPGIIPQPVVHSTPAVPPQQLPHAQAVPPASTQGLPGVAQQMGYPPTQPAPSQAVHALPTSQGGGLPPEFSQHQPILQAPVVTQPLPPMPASLPPVAAAAPSGACPAMAAGQQPVVSLSASVSQPLHQGLLPQQTSSVQVPQASQGAIAPQMLPGAAQVAAQQLIQAQPLPPEPQQPAPTPAMASSQVAPTVPPSVPADSQPGLSQSSPPVPSGTRSSLAHGQGSQPPAGAQYISPPSVTTTQLEDAQRLLFQHHSLLSLPKMAAGDASSEAGASLGAEGSSGANALTASAGLFPLKSLPVDGEDDGSSGASVVAIDNKIEQAMDLVKSHLMYAVREEVEVLKEQIKELIERNSQLEQENNLLKNLASPEQLAQFQAQVQSSLSPPSVQQPGAATQQGAPSAQPASQSSGGSA